MLFRSQDAGDCGGRDRGTRDPVDLPGVLLLARLHELDQIRETGQVAHERDVETLEILEEGGVGAQGYVEVVPIGTRMPNVPELAWKNKINGWVLVAFNVQTNGRTHNIRVLNANPRGIFEEKVIAAVEDWLYSVTYFGDLKGDIVLTQKVDVEWKNYPKNVLDMDR